MVRRVPRATECHAVLFTAALPKRASVWSASLSAPLLGRCVSSSAIKKKNCLFYATVLSDSRYFLNSDAEHAISCKE